MPGEGGGPRHRWPLRRGIHLPYMPHMPHFLTLTGMTPRVCDHTCLHGVAIDHTLVGVLEEGRRWIFVDWSKAAVNVLFVCG